MQHPEPCPVQEVYDKSWTQGGYPAQSCWGCRFSVDIATRLPFNSVLDAGTGNGALVRLMRRHGGCEPASGLEICSAAAVAQRADCKTRHKRLIGANCPACKQPWLSIQAQTARCSCPRIGLSFVAKLDTGTVAGMMRKRVLPFLRLLAYASASARLTWQLPLRYDFKLEAGSNPTCM